ncbi:hypothetical protein SAMN05421853_10746 [Roseivivax halotolerans]|uniref:Uncharacterized protein n=1 Tax=Roseivivax halotolerans TaxID=93684 RepID=A0A1I5YY31_9RHOB|nr:hypothetical protein [Roseivivax halotolerans]SFQ49193.1 hypothetical protein SAMN05421853_10746 [Roseivivax halotolerans]
MTTELLLAFAISFGAGPLLFLILTRAEPSVALMAALAIGALALMVAGSSLVDRAPFAAVACLWLAWVSAVAFMAHAAMRAMRSAPLRKWARVTGSLATTLPWFGLATAQFLTS